MLYIHFFEVCKLRQSWTFSERLHFLICHPSTVAIRDWWSNLKTQCPSDILYFFVDILFTQLCLLSLAWLCLHTMLESTYWSLIVKWNGRPCRVFTLFLMTLCIWATSTSKRAFILFRVSEVQIRSTTSFIRGANKNWQCIVKQLLQRLERVEP